MPRIFAYIVHKSGVADDSAAELAAAARKIDAAQAPAAVVTGWGADLDAVCESPARVLWRGLEDRERSAGLPECRTGAEGAGERAAGRLYRAGSACAFRHRSRRRDFPSR